MRSFGAGLLTIFVFGAFVAPAGAQRPSPAPAPTRPQRTVDRHHARAGAGRLAADAVAVVSRLGDVIVYDGASGTRTFVTRTTGAESSARSPGTTRM